MDGIREIALTFCAAAVVSAALFLLRGRVLEKSSRYVIALVLICSVISSVFSANVTFSLPENAGEERVLDTARELSLTQAELLIRSYLTEKGVNFEKVLCRSNKSEGDSIIISEVVIYGADEEAKTLLTELGIDCKVTVK